MRGLPWRFKMYVELHVVYVCVLGTRLDIYVGNCFRVIGVDWGLDTHLGNQSVCIVVGLGIGHSLWKLLYNVGTGLIS